MKQGALTDQAAHQGSQAISFRPLLTVALHIIGVLVVAVGVAVVVLPGAYAQMIWSAGQHDAALGQTLLWQTALHVGISTLLWMAIVAVFQSVRRRRRLRKRIVQRQRGSVYLEFIAVWPVFLLLTFGLLQLLFINIGGALARVAAYEAARTAWLWEPEVNAAPPNAAQAVTVEDVEDRIRISAALVMTPVAPGDYEMSGDVTERFEMTREAMVARFLPDPTVANVTSEIASIQQLAGDSPASLVKSLDSSSFPNRAFRKLTFSYLATQDVELIDEPGRVGARFNYNQHMAMPIVNVFLGQENPGLAGRGGHYFVWDVEYTFPPQRHGPNRTLPGD